MKLLRVTLKCMAAAALIGTGTVLLVLPGPGLPLIAAGIALLGTEFEWAARCSTRMSELWRAFWSRVAPARAAP